MKKKYKNTFMKIAYVWANESYCKRRQVGAVIVKNNRDIAPGYNGTVSGSENCCEEEFNVASESHKRVIKTKNAKKFCKKNGLILISLKSIDKTHSELTYKRPSLRTKASVVHAEANAIAFAAKKGISTENCKLFVTLSPCMNCANLIIQSGIKEVYYSEEYRDSSGIEYLKSNGIYVEQYKIKGTCKCYNPKRVR